MIAWLPAVPYPQGDRAGYWDPITSTLDWCEENYYATHYAAEFVNTLTNLLFLYLASKGIVNCLRNGHDRIFLVTFCGYLVVGSGSFAFHATLKCMSYVPLAMISELTQSQTQCSLSTSFL